MTKLELDMAIAEKIMGWVFETPRHGNCCTCQRCGRDHETCMCFPCDFSDDLEAAWDIVEKLAKQGMTCHVEWKGASREYPFTAEVTFTKDWMKGWAIADTVSEAICKAALKAIDE